MTSFAPGTPKKVMKKVNRQFDKAQQKMAKNYNPNAEAVQLLPGKGSVMEPIKGLPGVNGAPSMGNPTPGNMPLPSKPMPGMGGSAGLGTVGRQQRAPVIGPQLTPKPGEVPMQNGLGILKAPTITSKTLMKKGGKVSSASSRADGIATKGKTRGKIV